MFIFLRFTASMLRPISPMANKRSHNRVISGFLSNITSLISEGFTDSGCFPLKIRKTLYCWGVIPYGLYMSRNSPISQLAVYMILSIALIWGDSNRFCLMASSSFKALKIYNRNDKYDQIWSNFPHVNYRCTFVR